MTTSVAPGRRSFGSLLLAYSIAFPLFGRAAFPIVREKSGITLLSSFTDPQMVSTYLLGLILFVRLVSSEQVLRWSNFRTISFLAFFVLVALCSAVNSRIPMFSVWRCFEVTLTVLWTAAMVQDASASYDSARAIRTFYAISVAILVAVIVGLVLNPTGAWLIEGDVARLTGTTGYMTNSNEVGVIAAVISVGAYVRAVEFRRLHFVMASLFFAVICYFSHSRGSYIAFTCGFICANVMLARIVERRVAIWVSILFPVLIVCVLLAVSSDLRDFFVFLMTRGHEVSNLEGFGGRLQLWEFGLSIFKLHPLLGTGYGTYPDGLEGGHFHNIFMELLVTTGIVGVLCYMAFLFNAGSMIRKVFSKISVRQAAQRTLTADILTIPVIILVANMASAGSAYFSWDLLGLVSVVAAVSSLANSSTAIHSVANAVRPPNIMF